MRLNNTVRPMILLLFLTTTGCASGPDYHAPKLPDTAMGPFVSQSPQVDAAAPPEDWWRLYDDQALDAIVHEALAANTDLRIALANLDRARAISGEARGQMLPATTLAGGVKRSRDRAERSQRGAGQCDEHECDGDDQEPAEQAVVAGVAQVARAGRGGGQCHE